MGDADMADTNGPPPSKLFQPIQVGPVTLAHRVVLAPLTRLRAAPGGVHGALAETYYAQRAGVPGTLLVTEATAVAHFAGGRGPNSPGVFTAAQVAAWKRVRVAFFSGSPRPDRGWLTG